MTEAKVAELREQFMGALQLQLKHDRDLAKAAWDAGFAAATMELTGELKRMNVELERKHAYECRRRN